MTDTSSLAITHATTDSHPGSVSAPLGSPTANGAVSDSLAPDEEEPYTIKCVCDFAEDDGSTVYCERCETWQHIICYYPDKRVPDVHNCVDCEPRPLDVHSATERQRQQRLREQNEDGNRKKRSAAKSHKKKFRDRELNGYGSHGNESAPREHPPAKKTKTGHRSSASISTPATVPPFPLESRKRRSSISTAPSPTKLSLPSIPLFSNEFLRLYDHDDERVDMDSNLFVNVSLLDSTATWVKDQEALSRVANGHSRNIFNRSDAALDKTRWPALKTETITDSSIDFGGRHPTWKIVRTQDAVRKDHIVGEITGKVGGLDDYCLDPKNRWPELRHPEPFVFFNPQLPLYIDSRHEGSILRYTRRSCSPNVTMKIFITNDVEYHFCFVAKEDIPANSEITVMWYLDTRLSGSTNGLVRQQEDSTTEVAAICISNTLANFGGCACDQPNCLLASLDRRRSPKWLDSSKQVNGKRKKTRAKPLTSPRDPARAPASRAGSETTKHPEDDDGVLESRSSTGSARGQPHSRDLSPATTGPTELSTREKRKIADAEKQFQQLEQQDHRPAAHKKKKRASGPRAVSPVMSTLPQSGATATHRGGTVKPLHLDTTRSHSPMAATSPGLSAGGRNRMSRGTSVSHTPLIQSPLSRVAYSDTGVQCDLVESEDEEMHDASCLPDSAFEPRSVRILGRFKAECMVAQELARQELSSAGSDSTISSGNHSSPMLSPLTKHEKHDAALSDHGLSTSSVVFEGQKSDKLPGAASSFSSLVAPTEAWKPVIPPPWPSTAAHNTRVSRLFEKSVGPMPPPTSRSVHDVSTPTSTSHANIPSLSASNANSHSATPSLGATASNPTPTPAKKKLSLGDYLIRRGTMTTPTSEKTQSQAFAHTQQSPVSTLAGDAASTGENRSLIKPTPDLTSEPHGALDVVMKDAPESTQPPFSSIPS
ncbi:hypothetical protein N7539_005820 [Penicillium diatomitis]|uniref:SET domain-containing protein n=1 Tax=Penicillium diatomitis TaxID=2819901 RepID=A0A9W9X6C7_9EURO|nr:uncharacterized protein N7539_005820 [Penicillium diatomitis]KAJ5484024.1 hypothetical protein N7539_005820 [Penicillium diatomitis]